MSNSLEAKSRAKFRGEAVGNSYATGRQEVRRCFCNEGRLTNIGYEVVAKISSVGQIKDLEDRWQRRNWTGSDYSTAALIAANID